MLYNVCIEICYACFHCLFKTHQKPSEIPQLYFHRTPQNNAIIHRLNAVKYYAPLWWACNPMAQTFLLEFLYNYLKILPTYPIYRQYVVTDDAQILLLDWIHFQEAPRAILCIFPGLVGTTDACYNKPWFQLCKQMNYSAVVVNRRGFHKDAPLDCHAKRLPTYMDAQDMRCAMDAIQRRFPTSPKFGIGYSAGGNHLIGCVHEHPDIHSILKGVINISCGNDVLKCQDITKSSSYLGRLLTWGPREMCAHNQAHPFYKMLQCANPCCIEQYDAHYAHTLGFPDIPSYYRSCSTIHCLERITLPTLCVMSQDDPLMQCGHREDYISIAASNHNIITVITRQGGHCAWIQNNFKSWVNELIVEYIEALLEKIN